MGDALALMQENKIGGIPVVDAGAGLIGIVTNRDLRFQRDMERRIDDVMTRDGLVTTHSSQPSTPPRCCSTTRSRNSPSWTTTAAWWDSSPTRT